MHLVKGILLKTLELRNANLRNYSFHNHDAAQQTLHFIPLSISSWAGQKHWRLRYSFFFLVPLFLSIMIHGTVFAASWSQWTKTPTPVFTGEYIAGDPSVINEGSSYRMSYTCLTDLSYNSSTGEVFFHPAICQATSTDGLTWSQAPTGTSVSGLILQGRTQRWDENVEASSLFKKDSTYFLFYGGYRDQGYPAKGFPSSLGVARSLDGISFSRVSSASKLTPTSGWYDNDAITSPTIIQNGSSLVMVYVGHCYTNCNYGFGIFLLAATSTDGVNWKKVATPILQPSSSIPWMAQGVAEPAVVKGPDGAFYLFFTGVNEADRFIGVARSTSIFGTWQINPTPIVTPTPGSFDECGTLAPSVEINGSRVRMWYMGFTCEELPTVGYAESTWPLFR